MSFHYETLTANDPLAVDVMAHNNEMDVKDYGDGLKIEKDLSLLDILMTSNNRYQQ
jgi:hypothetical protein